MLNVNYFSRLTTIIFPVIESPSFWPHRPVVSPVKQSGIDREEGIHPHGDPVPGMETGSRRSPEVRGKLLDAVGMEGMLVV
jgi:hypothetical protein